MQKKIIALAIAAAFSAPAMAEVTMYGTMDGGVRHQTNDAADKGTTDTMQMGQYNTARFGFKGSDDLGDGLKVTMILETSLAPTGIGANQSISTSANQKAIDTASSMSNPFGLLFDRQATIGLSGGWGSFDMGWNYTTAFSTMKTYDPFDYKFLAVAGAKSSGLKRADANYVSTVMDRAGNMIFKTTFGDVTAQFEYDVNNGEKTAQPQQGVGRAMGVSYVSGPINVAAAYTSVEADLGAQNPTTHITAGAGYDYGMGKISIGYAKNTIDTSKWGMSTVTEDTAVNTWFGASYKATDKIEVTGAYYMNKSKAFATYTSLANQASGTKTLNTAGNESTKNTMMVGVTYDLSKKTKIYFEMDKATANTGASGAADTITTGTAAGLSTVF